MVSKNAKIAMAAIGLPAAGFGLWYLFMDYLPANSISKDPIGSEETVLSRLSTVIYMDQAKRIKVAYTTTSRPELRWASDFYPLSKLDKLYARIDVRYPLTASNAERAVNKLLKARLREASGLIAAL